MDEYFHPNEVCVAVLDGERQAFLKPNWREIRQINDGFSLIIGEAKFRVVMCRSEYSTKRK